MPFWINQFEILRRIKSKGINRISTKKNRKQVEARIRMAKKSNLNPPQKSTRAAEPVQSAAFKKGYRKG